MAMTRSDAWRRREANRLKAEARARWPENMIPAGRTAEVRCRTDACGNRTELDLLALCVAGRGQEDLWFSKWRCTRCGGWLAAVVFDPPVSGISGQV